MTAWYQEALPKTCNAASRCASRRTMVTSSMWYNVTLFNVKHSYVSYQHYHILLIRSWSTAKYLGFIQYESPRFSPHRSSYLRFLHLNFYGQKFHIKILNYGPEPKHTHTHNDPEHTLCKWQSCCMHIQLLPDKLLHAFHMWILYFCWAWTQFLITASKAKHKIQGIS
jgi:hypothetical protein